MIYIVPKKFNKGFENHAKCSSSYDDITADDYKIIIDTITNLFGFKILDESDYFISNNNENLRIYDMHGNRTNGNYTNYYLDGIVAFDEYYKRFVVFQFREYFVQNDSNFHILDGLSQLRMYDNDETEINYELNKLVVFYQDIHDSQIVNLLDYNENYNKTIDLWKHLKVDDNLSIIENYIPKYKLIKWNNKELSENEFISQFNLDEKTIYNYNLFKEFLKFNFTHIEIDAGVDADKVNIFIESVYKNHDESDYEYQYSYTNMFIGDRPPKSLMDIPTEKISYLNKFLNSFVKHIQIVFSQTIKVNYKNFLHFDIEVKTIGIRIDQDSSLNMIDNQFDDIMFFVFTFSDEQIQVSIKTNNQVVKKELPSVIINKFTPIDEIKKFVIAAAEIN